MAPQALRALLHISVFVTGLAALTEAIDQFGVKAGWWQRRATARPVTRSST